MHLNGASPRLSVPAAVLVLNDMQPEEVVDREFSGKDSPFSHFIGSFVIPDAHDRGF